MSDLDLPLLPSAEQIRRRQFATVRRGFDPDQVQDYLNQVAIQVETLETELRDERLGASAKATGGMAVAPVVKKDAATAAAVQPAAPMPADAYEQLSKRFATVLQTADTESQRLITEARAQAEKLLADARIEADKIRVDAQANAEEARAKSAAELEKARAESDRVLGGLEQRRETLMTQMHDMQSRLMSVVKDLDVPVPAPAAAAAPTPMGAAAPAGRTPATPVPPVPAPAITGKHAPQPPVAPKEATPTPVGQGASSDEGMVDPRYEDLWASTETRSVDIPDLAALDIDFDDEDKE